MVDQAGSFLPVFGNWILFIQGGKRVSEASLLFYEAV